MYLVLNFVSQFWGSLHSFEKSLLEKLLLARRVLLTPREKQLVSSICQGLRNKELAYTMGITEGIVKVHLSRLFKKLGVNDRFELALYALKNFVSVQASLPSLKSLYIC